MFSHHVLSFIIFPNFPWCLYHLKTPCDFQNQEVFKGTAFHCVSCSSKSTKKNDKSSGPRFIQKTLCKVHLAICHCDHWHPELSGTSSDTVFSSLFGCSVKTSIWMHLFYFTHYVISHFQYLKVTAGFFWHTFVRRIRLDCYYYRLQHLRKGERHVSPRILKLPDKTIEMRELE